MAYNEHEQHNRAVKAQHFADVIQAVAPLIDWDAYGLAVTFSQREWELVTDLVNRVQQLLARDQKVKRHSVPSEATRRLVCTILAERAKPMSVDDVFAGFPKAAHDLPRRSSHA